MCDYSLAGLSNRLALQGEPLVVKRFPSGCLGMGSPRRRLVEILFPSMAVAVCIPPGARLRLRDIPVCLQEQLEVSGTEEVTFVQRTADAFTHRDGLRFGNGREVLLQNLKCGQRVMVLRLECDDPAAPDNSGLRAATPSNGREDRNARNESYVASAGRQ